jgi:alkylation response protein AidB-like acyl-CoA dehydrogenase
MAQPARFGGYELGWETVCEVSMILGRGDASQAWVANIYAEHAYVGGLFSDEAQRDVWGGNPDALISASIIPLGNRVEAVEGGYRLSGRWPFASGVHHSDWTIVGEMVAGGGGPPRHLFFLVPKADVVIVDDWHTAGMVGTGSMTVALNDAFVPAYRTLDNADVIAGTAPGASLSPLASVPVGVAQGMVEDFARFVAERAARKPAPPALEALYARVSESAAEVKAARLLILDAASTNMRKLAAGGRLAEADGTHGMHQTAYAAQLVRRAAARLFEASGAHGIYLSNGMQRAFRDIYTATVHAALNWDRHALAYGQMMAQSVKR